MTYSFPALVMTGAADTEMLLGHPLHLRRVRSGINFFHGSALHIILESAEQDQHWEPQCLQTIIVYPDETL